MSWTVGSIGFPVRSKHFAWLWYSVVGRLTYPLMASARDFAAPPPAVRAVDMPLDQYSSFFYDAPRSQWVVVGKGVSTSPDLVTWTAQSLPAGFIPNGSSAGTGACRFDGHLFMAIDNSHRAQPNIITSPDCVTWTQHLVTADADQISTVCGSGTQWLAVLLNRIASRYEIHSSTDDGVTWSMIPTPTLESGPLGGDPSWAPITWCPGSTNAVPVSSAIFFGDGKFYARAQWVDPSGYYPTGLFHSPDGITWTPASYQPAGWGPVSNTHLQNMIWNGSYWVMVGASGAEYGAVWTSPDGDVWTKQTIPATLGNSGIMFLNWDTQNGQWVIVGREYPGYGWNVSTSPDGVTWTAPVLLAGAGETAFQGMAVAPGR